MRFYFSVPDLSKKYMKIRLNYLSDSQKSSSIKWIESIMHILFWYIQ